MQLDRLCSYADEVAAFIGKSMYGAALNTRGQYAALYVDPCEIVWNGQVFQAFSAYAEMCARIGGDVQLVCKSFAASPVVEERAGIAYVSVSVFGDVVNDARWARFAESFVIVPFVDKGGMFAIQKQRCRLF